MVRSVLIEESLKNDMEKASSGCTVLIGTIYEEKRYVLGVFDVPISTDIESDFESSIFQLLYALPGGCYPIGVCSTEKVISLLNILKKSMQRLQKLVSINESLLEPFVSYKCGNKIESKIMIDGQLKPLSIKYHSFFASWNQVCSYINIQHHIFLPKFKSLKQWQSSFRAEISVLIKDLGICKVHFSGNRIKNDKSYFEDPGKAKNTIGKILHPKLIFPLVEYERLPDKTNVSSMLGSLYTHVYVPPKISTEQTREIILEDIAKSIYCRAESFCEFQDEIGDEDGAFNSHLLRLPYRVTFPLGLVELSVYLLQDEKISQAAQIASDLFDISPTNLKAHEECQELKNSSDFRKNFEDDKNDQFRNILLMTLGGVLAFLVSVLLVSSSYWAYSFGQ